MTETKQTPSRKKFLLWTAAVLSSATVFRFFSGTKKPKKAETVKMLTQDGKLVEIDMDKMTGTKRTMITDPELKEWVKK